jgi:phosphate transport system substrate-binding protein
MRRLLFVSLLVLAVLAAACGSAATPTQAPQPTQAVQAPTNPPAPTTAPKATTAATQAPQPTNTTAPAAGGLSGTLSLGGSTTVQPLAEVLGEAFMKLNPGVTVQVQGGGSAVGVTSVGDGTVDIGDASRAVQAGEMQKYPDLQVFTIAYDGIAIIVNPGVDLPNGLTIAQVRSIFTGETTNFKDVGGPDATIVVVSREEGSGTRTAFQELVMNYKDASGTAQTPPITDKALLQQSNGQVRTTVSTTPDSIGYLSFGFLDNTVKGVKIGRALPVVVNVIDGNYPVVRPLNMLTKGAPNALAQAFLDYVLGPEGQAIVEQDYIAAVYTPPTNLSGKLTLAGSTTVQPLAEQLAEAFMSLNPGLTIEVQGGGSSVGVTSVGDGTVDIGNASRAVKDAEFEQYPDLQPFVIAYDGIAVVINPGMDLPNGLTKEQVQGIFSGEITNYKDVGGPDATIVVVSREEGSGTRTAFEELVMTYKDASGANQVKPITDRALLQQSNGQVRTTVSTTPDSIGYLSFGFLDSSVKAVNIGGVEPIVANVKNGTYPIVRPLNMLTKGAPNELANAFIYYVLSPLGQEIVVKNYISYK